ncbi:organic cation transporter protein-like [Glandiceps talaboti]
MRLVLFEQLDVMKQFEEVIATVGNFGRYQKLQCILFLIVGGSNSFYMLGNTFYSASADHYCRVFNNQTYTDVSPVKNCTIPYITNGNNIVWNKCKRYDVNVSQSVSADVCFPRSDTTLSCDHGWVYDKTWYENTVVFEYDLVCHKDWMKQLSKSILPVGNLVGSVIFGQLSDIYGRKPVYIMTLTISVVFAIGTAFSTSYTMFIIGQFCLGVFPISLFITSQVMMLEMIGMRFRSITIILIHIGFSISYILLGVIGWLLNGDWRKMHLIVGISWAIFLPSIFLITESPMWLMQKHKYDKCEKILKRFARFNKTNLPDNIFEEEKEVHLKSQKEEGEHRYTLLDLLKPPKLRLRTLLMCLNWFSCAFVYYGISLNTDQIGDNPYTTFILSGLVEIIGRILVIMLWFRNVLYRRWSVCGLSLFAGVALILCELQRIPGVSVAIAMVAKMCIAVSYSMVFIYGMEIYPTVARNAGMGVSAMSAGVGVIISPYVMLLDVYWTPLPFVIMGGTSVIAGLAAFFLPETRNRKLPGTIEEGEEFGTTGEGDPDRKSETQSLISGERPGVTETKQPDYGTI